MSTPASLLHSAVPASGLPPSLNAVPDWKAEINARLREHRERRGEADASQGSARHNPATTGTAGSAASRVAARVAARYNNAPSYQDLLAASATAAAAAAQSAATAAVEAQAAAEAALVGWENHQAMVRQVTLQVALHAADEAERSAEADATSSSPARSGRDICADSFFTATSPALLATDAAPHAGAAVPSQFPGNVYASPRPVAAGVEHHTPLPERMAAPSRTATRSIMGERARSLVDAFAEAVVPAAQSLPAKLIEFPRELIAPRKQRPRLAEGPLSEQEPAGGRLRIFEVDTLLLAEDSAETRMRNETPSGAPGIYAAMEREPDHRLDDDQARDTSRRRAGFQADRYADAYADAAGRSPGTREATATRRATASESGWQSIRLGQHPQQDEPQPTSQPAGRRPEHGYEAEAAPPLHDLAPLTDRLMAALIDGAIVSVCFLISMLVFSLCTVHAPTGKAAVVAGLVVLGTLAAFYGWLFMSFGGGSTPGMRYAHIALCTFSDENPTRRSLRRRVPATALALLPLGLGVLWAILDEDKLGWHDRMTRTYQRSYK
ncbi:RDD family protein [Acidipila sp. EB88]|uniref:RDD family protein n=1 Tax=Acidipila sp. EB88 TaxID=2305226 RepID=UPI000F5FA6AF|nr:RDD family protein [Acidipila sp. EB88]RRA48375.1 RDD family protein [Acidipila sp. EB88]